MQGIQHFIISKCGKGMKATILIPVMMICISFENIVFLTINPNVHFHQTPKNLVRNQQMVRFIRGILTHLCQVTSLMFLRCCKCVSLESDQCIEQ